MDFLAKNSHLKNSAVEEINRNIPLHRNNPYDTDISRQVLPIRALL